jgi:hypothetical protein
VIAVVFLLLLVGVMLVVAAFGGNAGPLPIAELLVLIALFVLFFGAGVNIAAVLGVLALILARVLGPPFWPSWKMLNELVLLVAIPLFPDGEIMRAGRRRSCTVLNVFSSPAGRAAARTSCPAGVWRCRGRASPRPPP